MHYRKGLKVKFSDLNDRYNYFQDQISYHVLDVDTQKKIISNLQKYISLTRCLFLSSLLFLNYV